MIWLRGISRSGDGEGYPMGVPAIRALQPIRFRAPVAIFTGENGSGKTTLIELMAELCRAHRIDAVHAPGDKLDAIRAAAPMFRAAMARRPKHCFYFHAEGFIRYSDDVFAMRAEAKRELADIRGERRYGSDYARELASQPYAGALAQMEIMYAGDITASSHGESFLTFFGARLAPDGLYLLDEPEGALSFYHQYVLALMIRDAVERGCQFVIATHSPVLTALPGAQLMRIDGGQIAETAYDELPDVAFLRDFFRNPRQYLRGE